MAYEMPLVCKEVYLPFDDTESLTPQLYKLKYGIDLNEHFIFTQNGDMIIRGNKNTKYYLVLTLSNYGYPSQVLPMINTSTADEKFGIGAIRAVDSVGGPEYIFIKYDGNTQLLSVVE